MPRDLTQSKVLPLWLRGKKLSLIVLIHALPIWAIATGTDRTDWIFFAIVYPIQAIGVGIAMHRYFAHRAFKTSRTFQFLLALSSAAGFGSAIGFAGKHRIHHGLVDQEGDVHTPRHGMWACWIGSLLDCGYTDEQIMERVRDWTKYPELVWLHRHSILPGLALSAVAFAVGGLSTVAIGVCLGTAILVHQAGAVNYLTHIFGTRRYETRGTSTNSMLVSLFTFGEGWHNNHHHSPGSARAGFVWWEIDLFYYLIWIFSKLGLVWDLRPPPKEFRATVTADATS